MLDPPQRSTVTVPNPDRLGRLTVAGDVIHAAAVDADDVMAIVSVVPPLKPSDVARSRLELDTTLLVDAEKPHEVSLERL